jgi:hypothetical protein
LQMGNRAAKEKAAIEQSATHSEDPKKRPQLRSRSIAALYTSWGGLDCDFYFRWAEAAIGFRAQAMEPQAETIGRPLVPFWDHVEALKDRVKRDPKLQKLLDYIMRTTGGAAARPGSTRQAKVCMQPDRTTDDQLVAVRRYRRVDAGMGILRATEPRHFAVLHHTFLPKRNPPEIESAFGQLADLVIRLDRVTGAHASAMAREAEKDRVSLETWLLRRIERHDGIVALALEEAEGMALGAVKAFEAVAEPPKEIREAQKAAAEGEPKKRTRAPKVVSLGYD